MRRNSADAVFQRSLLALGVLLLVVGVLFAIVCARLAAPTIARIGALKFLVGSNWNPVEDDFGALPFIYGTVVTSLLAIALATPIALGTAIFVVELAPVKIARGVTFLVDLLAGIPSVVFGLWGLGVVVPLLRATVSPIGLGLFTAGLVLSIMILPTIASLSIHVLRVAPRELREGALALGATRWEAIRTAVLPFARRGLFGAVLLGLVRALGETMAVTMVIGNQPEIHASWLQPGYSLPSVIANEFAEATGTLHTGALAALALVLMLVTVAMVAVARAMMRMSERSP